MQVTRAALFAAAAVILIPATSLAQGESGMAASPTRGGTAPYAQPAGDDMEAGTDGTRSVHAAVLSPSDHAVVMKAFDAANHGDWAAARALADQSRDPVARKLVLWRFMLSPDSHASFEDIDSFIRDNPDWPLQRALAARAEHVMPPGLAPSTVIAWFGARTPASGIGKVRLGEALIASGEKAKGREMIRDAWVHDSFTADEEATVATRDADMLTAQDQNERLTRLIGRGDLPAARRQLLRVSKSEQRIAEVRMALQSQPKSGERMLGSLPDSLRDDPGLMLDRARLLRAQGDKTVLPETLIKSPVKQLATIDPGRWWDQIALAARESMENHDYQLAYRLVSEARAPEGEAYASAQFMAGWLALHFLHDSTTAIAHFKKLEDNVSRPISLARAHYWLGRAYEAEGHDTTATREYRRAAENPDTYYGQLALARLDPDAKLKLMASTVDPAKAAAAYDKDELTRAIRILADLGAERFLRLFAVHDVEAHPDPSRVAALAADLVRLGYRDIAVRVAKAASYESINLPSYLHPVITLPPYRGPGVQPEPALVLALIRQETEFNSAAVSGAGARGLMQMMPSAGQKMAQLSGLPWKPADLTTDDTYNMQLGMTELSTHLAAWGGSYVLAAAGYNAGDRNVQRWLDTFGDPRTGAIDPIDWIELIPFSETRNYVQRVIENLEVYRDRLSGHSQRNQILADLYRPNATPDTKPLPKAASDLPDPPEPVARPIQSANKAAAVTSPAELAVAEPAPRAIMENIPARDETGNPGIEPSPRPNHEASRSAPHRKDASRDRHHGRKTASAAHARHRVAERAEKPTRHHHSAD